MKKLFTLVVLAFMAMSMNAKVVVPLTNGIEGIDENGVVGEDGQGVLYTYDAAGYDATGVAGWWCNDITGYKYLQVVFEEASEAGSVGFEDGSWTEVGTKEYEADADTVTLDVTAANNTCPAILFHAPAGSTLKVKEVAWLTANEVENPGGSVIFDPTAEKTIIPATFSNIDEDGVVGGDGNCQAELYHMGDPEWWMTDATAYDFLVLTVEESSAAGKFYVFKDDWTTNFGVGYEPNQQYVVIDLNNDIDYKANLACVVVETEVGSTLKIQDLAYMNGVSEGIEGVEYVSNQQTPIYNLAGQRVGTAKGIVIKNGKKYIVK